VNVQFGVMCPCADQCRGARLRFLSGAVLAFKGFRFCPKVNSFCK